MSSFHKLTSDSDDDEDDGRDEDVGEAELTPTQTVQSAVSRSGDTQPEAPSLGPSLDRASVPLRLGAGPGAVTQTVPTTPTCYSMEEVTSNRSEFSLFFFCWLICFWDVVCFRFVLFYLSFLCSLVFTFVFHC